MGNNASTPVDRRAVAEVIRSSAIATLSERLTEEDGLLGELSREDVYVDFRFLSVVKSVTNDPPFKGVIDEPRNTVCGTKFLRFDDTTQEG